MGLGWIINRKPNKGYEKEFNKLNKIYEQLLQNQLDTEDIENQINNISTYPESTNVIFSGKCIFNSSLINDELREEACIEHNYIQAIDYANRLEIDINNINVNNLNDEEYEDYNYILKGIEWLKSFGENGYGYSVCY